jgi:hypothetical protein
MNTFRTIIASFAMLLCFQVSVQADGMNFKLKQMDEMTWGVFAVPSENIAPSKRSNTGSGQVTIVAPIDFLYTGLENFGGNWIENARVDGPMEAPDNAYISFGFDSDEPRIKYVAGQETLLFTIIVEDIDAEISLIDNENDPFLAPNTFGTNPGNDLGVIDFDRNGNMLVYNYTENLETETNNEKAIFASKKSTENEGEGKDDFKAVFTSEKITTPSH